MAEDNLQPQKPQAQNNAPDNLPGIEVTSLDEITQLIKPKVAATQQNKIELSKSSQTDANDTSLGKDVKKIPNFYELYEKKDNIDKQNKQQNIKQETDLQKEFNKDIKEAISSVPVMPKDSEEVYNLGDKKDGVNNEIVTEQTKEDIQKEINSSSKEERPFVLSVPENISLETHADEQQSQVESIAEEIIEPSKTNLEQETEQVIDEQQDKAAETRLKSLRTYKSDLAQVVGTRKSSLIDIVSAESDKRNSTEQNKLAVISNEREAKDNFTKKVVVIVLSTTLIVLGIGSIFYFYGKSSPDIAGSSSKLSSIIFADDNLEFNITNLSRRQIINELASIKDSTQLSIGRIKNILITESFTDEQGIEKRALVSATDFLNAIDARVPTSFLRSLQPNFMVGVHVFDGNQPFIVLKTSFYENAFVGMLEWEKYIKEDLSQLFAEKNTKTTLTQIATTTSEIKTFMFNDLVLKNKDTRILKNKEGEMTLMYSFVDKNTIIITTNENTFGEILTRRGSSRIVQ